jgi:hypothetical protein
MIEWDLAMIIIRDRTVWWRLPNGAETQATPRQCVAEIERLRAELSHIRGILTDRENEITRLRTALAPLAALKLWRDTYPDAAIDTLVDRNLACYFTPDQVRRARDILKSARCPGGGWTGMPEGTDPTVDACMKAGACGCDLGDALRPDGQLTEKGK